MSPSPPKRPLSPSSLHDLSSPSAPLARPAPFPAPPTGHDLMLLFPPAPPALRDVDIVAGVDRPFAEHQNRPSAFQGEVRARVLAGRYVNTSTWFGDEERAFFARLEPRRRGGGGGGVHPASSSSPSSSSSSTASSSSPPPPPPPQHAHAPIVPPPAFPAHSAPPARPRRPSRTPSPRQPHAIKAAAAAAAAAVAGAPRRRAGKYTKRVFVQPQPPDGAAVPAVKW